MNSVKNLVVVVMLLGVSYGAFQVINAPEPVVPDQAADLDFDRIAPNGGGTLEAPMPWSEDEAQGDQTDPGLNMPDLLIPEPMPLADREVNRLRDPRALDNPPMAPDFLENASGAGLGQSTPPVRSPGIDPGLPRTELEAVVPKPPVATRAPTRSPAVVDWRTVEQLVADEQFLQALRELSSSFRADVPVEQQQKLLSWLDALAGKVIYSTEHWLEPRPHVVREGETLDALASQWNVPRELIFNINRQKLNDSMELYSGAELKVVRGPFDAVVSLEQQFLTLFVDGLYAGRFPIVVGQDRVIPTRQMAVVAKSDRGQTYEDPWGTQIPAGDSTNPYGKYWIGLEDRICIHDDSQVQNSSDTRGSIRLSQKDASDLFGILSPDSKVSIMR